jgi:hypothetical protein
MYNYFKVKTLNSNGINIQYRYIVGKYNLFAQALETDRKASLWRTFLACFAATANKFYF